MSYTVIITEEVAANIAVTTQNYPITIEYNATSIESPTGSYGDSNVRALLNTAQNVPINTTGNVQANFFVGNGSQLTGLASTYGNANVAANLAAFGSNPITTTGNITAGYFSGNASLLTAVTGANVIGAVAQATQANSANTATSAGSATTATTANVALVANSVAGANVTGAVAQATQAGTANIALVANSVAGANVTGVVAQATQAATANVANSVAGANVTGVVAQATQANAANTATTAGSATTAGTVTGAAQGNITSVGTLTGLTVSGNVTAGNLLINTDAVITGNLTVNGTTTTINSNVVTVNDKTFVLANNQSTSSGVDGSGIIAGNPAVASILYSNANTAWETNIGVNVSGAVSATGNITGNYFIGNGSQLTGLPANYGDSNVVTLLGAFGSNTISTTGNVQATAFTGSGSALSNLTGANVTGNVSSALFAITAGTASAANTAGTSTFADTANAVAGANVSGTVASANAALFLRDSSNAASFVAVNDAFKIVQLPGGGFVSWSGDGVDANTVGSFNLVPGGPVANSYAALTSLNASNPTANPVNSLGAQQSGVNMVYDYYGLHGGAKSLVLNGNSLSTNVPFTSTGNIISSGNVSGNFFLGNGSALTGITATATPAGANTELQFNDGGATGASANLTFNKTSNTLITTNANIGNVSIVGSTINNTNAFNASQTPNPFRVIYGNGYDGDYGTTGDPLGVIRNSLLTIQTKHTSTTSDTNHGVRGYSGLTYNDLNGQTHTNPARRGGGSGSTLWLGNGTVAMTAVPYLGAAGAGGTVIVGNVGTVNMGNATIGHAAGSINLVIGGGGANIGNAVGVIGQVQISATAGNVATAIGMGTQFVATATPTVPPTTVIGYYMPGSTGTYGLSTGSVYRGAANYYFLKNDDNAAQAQLGSLRAYHEFEAATATSGSFAIDKNTAQVHNIVPTGNCTITGYSNMVTSASDGTNTDAQVDTLTIIVEQGATPYTVTLPTGSTYKYAGNISTVGTTANSVTMISVTAANVAGTTTYLTTVSPEFV
jgi:hypothetical protein